MNRSGPLRRGVLLLAALALVACAHPPPEGFTIPDDEDEPPLHSVSHVDLTRYAGRWYLIANIPYFAERGNVGVYVEYSMRDDGTLADDYTARDSFDEEPFTKHGSIEIANPMTHAEGRITFLPPIWQDYAVVFLDKDYRYSVIAHPTRNYCWIFAREPRMPDDVYEAALEALKDNGFDLDRIFKVPQQREDVGQPGFQ